MNPLIPYLTGAMVTACIAYAVAKEEMGRFVRKDGTPAGRREIAFLIAVTILLWPILVPLWLMTMKERDD